MPGPGEYRPDPTVGIDRIEDLPKPRACYELLRNPDVTSSPEMIWGTDTTNRLGDVSPVVATIYEEFITRSKIRCQSRTYRRRPCPRCGNSAYRDGKGRRTLHDLGNPLTGRPRDIIVIDSQHDCTRCRKYFNADMSDLADRGSHYTRRVVAIAVRLVVEDGLPYRTASWSLWRDHRVFVPFATIQNWVEAGGEKGGAEDRHRLPRLGTLRLLGLHRGRRVV